MGVQGWDLCGIREDDFIFKKNINTNTYTYYTVNPYYINPPSIITSKASSTSTAGTTK